MYGVVKKTESVLGMSFAIGLFNAAKPAHLMQKWIAKKKGLRLHATPFSSSDFGSSTWARTRDLRINSPALYRLSY